MQVRYQLRYSPWKRELYLTARTVQYGAVIRSRFRRSLRQGPVQGW